MNAMQPVPVDPTQLSAFFDATFRHADAGTFINLRSFYEGSNDTFSIRGHRLTDDLPATLPAIIALAEHCADAGKPVVFCPPVATFKTAQGASETDLANGLTLSVECDSAPSAALIRLEALLGAATVVVASGGEWVDAGTGEIEGRLHAHWGLAAPTHCDADHAALKEARRLAARLVDADPSNVPPVHPIRWAGSVHRKAAPRLVRIAALTDHVIDLSDALACLRDAAEGAGLGDAAPGNATSPGERGAGDEHETADLVRAILTGEDFHTPIVTLAMRMLKGGMPDAAAVLHLRGVMQAVPMAVRDVKGGTSEPGRWKSRYDDIPRAVHTARAKLGAPAAEDEPPPASDPDAWPAPLDFLADQDTIAPLLTVEHIPVALQGFVSDTAQRMGVDPATVALACIVACASVATDDWRVQPKRHDHTWTESPRLWGAIVGDPSILKSPVIAACTNPIDKIDAQARRRHQEAMRLYKARLREFKADKTGQTPEPVHPKLDRHMVEGATVEAISEVLRDDDDALQRAPAGKVLSRHDEMSEFFGNLDRYKAGGKGGGDRGAYLRLFNGGPYTIDRIGRGAFSVPNWSACFLGGIQPGPIQRIAKDAAEDGLLQRFLYVVPGPQEPGLDRAPAMAAQNRYHALFPVLVTLGPPRMIDGKTFETVTLHADAHQHREAVDVTARAMMSMPDTSGRLKSALGKWPGIFARIALIYHLIDAADIRACGGNPAGLTVISEPTAKRAAAFMTGIVLPHLLRADALMFSTEQTGHARWIAGYILSQRSERVTTRDIVRAYRELRAPEAKAELAAIMSSLATVGWLEPEIPTHSTKPISAWTVNPAVHVQFASKAAAEKARRERTREKIAADIAAHRRQGAP